MPSDDFWGLSFIQLFKLFEKRNIHLWFTRYDLAALRADIINIWCKKRYKAEDFIGKTPVKKKVVKQASVDMWETIKAIFPTDEEKEKQRVERKKKRQKNLTKGA